MSTNTEEVIPARDEKTTTRLARPAGHGHVRPCRRYLHHECFDFGGCQGSEHDGQRRPVGHCARSAGIGCLHFDQQQGRRSDRQEARLCSWPARICDRGDRHDVDPKPAAHHYFLGDHRRAGRIAAAAGHAVADPWQFRRRARKKAYALVGAATGIAAAVGPLLGGFITTYLSWRVGFFLEAVIIAIVLLNIKLVKDVPYTGPRQIDVVGAILSVLGMGGIVLSILVWQEGGEAVGLLMAIGARRHVPLCPLAGAAQEGGQADSARPRPVQLQIFPAGYFRADAAEYCPGRHDDRAADLLPDGV